MNDISDTVVTGHLYCAANEAHIRGNVENTIENVEASDFVGSCASTFYGTSGNSYVSGHVKTVVTGLTVSGDYCGCGYCADIYGSSEDDYYAAELVARDLDVGGNFYGAAFALIAGRSSVTLEGENHIAGSFRGISDKGQLSGTMYFSMTGTNLIEGDFISITNTATLSSANVVIDGNNTVRGEFTGGTKSSPAKYLIISIKGLLVEGATDPSTHKPAVADCFLSNDGYRKSVGTYVEITAEDVEVANGDFYVGGHGGCAIKQDIIAKLKNIKTTGNIAALTYPSTDTDYKGGIGNSSKLTLSGVNEFNCDFYCLAADDTVYNESNAQKYLTAPPKLTVTIGGNEGDFTTVNGDFYALTNTVSAATQIDLKADGLKVTGDFYSSYSDIQRGKTGTSPVSSSVSKPIDIELKNVDLGKIYLTGSSDGSGTYKIEYQANTTVTVKSGSFDGFAFCKESNGEAHDFYFSATASNFGVIDLSEGDVTIKGNTDYYDPRGVEEYDIIPLIVKTGSHNLNIGEGAVFHATEIVNNELIYN